MLTKIIYVLIDTAAIASIVTVILALRKESRTYSAWLRHTMMAAVVAIVSNMLIACSADPFMAQLSYCAYFASIDWILYFLGGFCLVYTEHGKKLTKILSWAVAIVMAFDSLSILLNPVFGHHFSIYETTFRGSVFYQTAFKPWYYIHLGVDYVIVLLALSFIISAIVRNHDLYRMKYILILSVLLLVVALNLAYMTFQLVLDASVIFYAVAGTLIYFCIEIFVPRRLMSTYVGRAVDDMNEGLILLDNSNNCIYTNAFARSRFSIDPSTYDETCEPVATVLKSLNDQGRRYGEVEYVRREGATSEHYRVRCTSLLDRKGRSVGSYFLLQDRTEEVYYLHEIEGARISADNSNRAKSSFLANMSHEIRTPLNSVLGMNEMILRSGADPEIREYASSIKQSGETLLGLINDILDFSKIEAGRMDCIESDYEVQHLVRDLYTFFEHTAGEKDLYLRFECDRSVPRKLRGDMMHIRQVLANIISNAVKYTKEGGVTIKISARRSGIDRIDLKTDVVDTGIGISKEEIPVLFDAFRRINEKENATIQGTGLGLAITKQLVNLMKGSIAVESTVGVGTVFTVILPQEVKDPAPVGEIQLDRVDSEPVYKESFRAPEARALVVDDVPLNLKVARALLQNTMIKVDTAASGDEAIDMCRKNRYDVILLDHRMPKKDGIETFREISADGLNKDTPVIMLTANAVSGVEEEYRKAGFAGYLSKPIDVDAMESMLIKLLPESKVHKLR